MFILCAAYCCTFVSPIRPVLIGVYIIVAYSLHGAPVYMSLTHSLNLCRPMFMRSLLFNVYIQLSLLFPLQFDCALLE